MKNTWTIASLGDLAKIMYGKDHKLLSIGSVPAFGSGGIMRYVDKSLYAKESILIPRKGSLNNVIYVNNPFWTVDTMFWTVIDETKILPKYLYYQLTTMNLAELNVGSAVPSLTVPVLNGIQIPLPPLAEQHRIADILGTLDDKIALNRRMNATLEAMARALFKSWFVDFDPVHAKAAGRPTGLPAHIESLFPDSFVESALGPIPAGWAVGTVGDVVKLNRNSWSKTTRPSVIRYLDLSNTKWGHIEQVQIYSADEAPSRAQRVLFPGDIVVGTVRPGNGAYALISQTGLTGSTGFAVLQLEKEHFIEFIYCAVTSTENIDKLQTLADGGAYPAIRPEVVTQQGVVFPNETLISLFSSYSVGLFRMYSQNDLEMNTLTSTRDTLIPKLLSGELAV
jgi:type I restriction enzyme S subunit